MISQIHDCLFDLQNQHLMIRPKYVRHAPTIPTLIHSVPQRYKKLQNPDFGIFESGFSNCQTEVVLYSNSFGFKKSEYIILKMLSRPL